MKRRAFLFGSVAACGVLPVVTRAQPLGFQSLVSCIVITDVTPETSIEGLLTLFSVLTDAGLPFTCVVDPRGTEGQPIDASHDLAVLLSGFALQGAAFDVASLVPDLSDQSQYFQARKLRDAKSDLNAIVTQHRSPLARQSMFSVAACRDTDEPKNPSGARSAGVSTILSLPEQDAPVTSEAWQNGTVRIYGGTRIDLAVYTGTEIVTDPGATQAFYYVSANAIDALTPDALTQRAAGFASDLLRSERTGKNTVQLASELLLRDDYAFERFVAVHLVEPDVTDEVGRDRTRAFADDLRAEGIFASIGSHLGLNHRDEPTRYWLPVERAPDQGTAPEAQLTPVFHSNRSGLATHPGHPGKPLPAGYALAFGELNAGTMGLDGSAALWLPCLDVRDADVAVSLSDRLARTNDVVVSIRPEAIAQPYLRKAVVRQLLQLAGDGVSRIVPVQVLGQRIAPTGAELVRQRRTVGAFPKTRARRVRKSDAARQALMEDAKIAWGYIERNTIASTGLCPATVNFSPSDGRVHSAVTMWDVGSHINGLVAALRLGFIEKEKFEKNISQILTQVRGRESQGRLLPQGWIRVDRQKWGNRDFDGSDAGRLLASFENLRNAGHFEDRLSELVGKWDLDEIVIDGRVHSVVDGELQSVYRSHSAHYSARAFRRWGVDVQSPYEVMNGVSAQDGQMALLEAVSWIGPLGAEPLLLEAMELGMSRESAHLAEVLFAAQVEDFEETGRLIAVSEGPIDRTPWFTYQGLQLDADKRTWALDTVGSEAKYRTSEFWRDNLVVSSKAAFLWAAYKPHDYSDRLLQYVRSKSRTNRGFASSIFSKTGRVTATYTDLNTNGVILQAIAHALAEA